MVQDYSARSGKRKMLFERCLGEIFPVMGVDGDLLALDVGEINGLAPYLERSIFSPLAWRLLPKSEGFKMILLVIGGSTWSDGTLGGTTVDPNNRPHHGYPLLSL